MELLLEWLWRALHIPLPYPSQVISLLIFPSLDEDVDATSKTFQSNPTYVAMSAKVFVIFS